MRTISRRFAPSAAAVFILGTAIASAQMVTHFAGSTSGGGSSDGSGASASFARLNGIALDRDGNVIVADTLNNTIRRVSPEGAVTTIAGRAGIAGDADGSGAAARFKSPSSVAVDSSGDIFVSDQGNGTIRRISGSRGVVTTFAGTPSIFGSTDGTGATASFGLIEGIAFDAADNLFAADYGNDTIRKITPDGTVTTIAGVTGQSGSADGPAASALFNSPYGIVIDGAGTVYVSEFGNDTIRKITTDGTVSTLAGSPGVFGTTDGTGSAARFGEPEQLALDSNGNLFVADNGSYAVRKVTPLGVVTTVASSGTVFRPSGIAVDGHGTVHLADDVSVRTMSENGTNATTVAGTQPFPGFADAAGADARFGYPTDLALDRSHNLFVTDETTYRIRKIDPNGLVSTFAGSNEPGVVDGTGAAAQLQSPSGIAIDSNDNLYFTDYDTVRKATPSGVVTTIAGSPGMSGSTDATGTNARFNNPEGVALDSAGNIYVVDSGNKTIRKIDTSHVVTTLAGMAGQSGFDDGSGSAARFEFPTRMVFGPDGNLYVGDSMSIRVVTPSGGVSTLQLVTGDGRVGGFSEVNGLVFDAAGTLWVSDAGLSQIARVTGNLVTYPVGAQYFSGSADGTGQFARFSQGGLSGITLGPNGGLYVADTYNYCVRSIGADLGDRAVIDSSGSATGASRQLDVAPQNATAWKWTIYRQPAGSTAALSSATVRNPTFTPDAPGLYLFQLEASRGGLRSISTVPLTVVDAERAHAIR